MTRARENADGARLDAPLASPTFTGTPTTPVIKLTPTATSSAPTGSEGALYYDSDKDTLMKFTGDNVWNDVHSTFMKAKGPDGAEGVIDGIYKYHIFNATKTGSNAFSVTRLADVSANNAVEFLVIAGGGGAGGQGGGGGAGGYRASWNSEASGGTGSSESAVSVTLQNYNVTIGAGGAGGYSNSQNGASGSDSIWSSITSDGG